MAELNPNWKSESSTFAHGNIETMSPLTFSELSKLTAADVAEARCSGYRMFLTDKLCQNEPIGHYFIPASDFLPDSEPINLYLCYNCKKSLDAKFPKE